MSDTSHHVLTGKVDITSNLLVGSSHLFVDTNNNRVGLVTTDPHAGLHVNSNAYVNTDLRVGNQIEINATAGRIKAASFEGDGSLLQNTPPGADGAAATIAVGTTTTGAAGTSASVTNSGTTSAAVFNFTIPKGDQGIQGIPGNDGANGADGANGSDGADGTNYFVLSGSDIYRSTGNVGIGETSPQTTLHVKDVSDSTGTGDAFITGLSSNPDNRKPTECLRLQGQWRSPGSGALLRFTNLHTSGTNPNSYEYNLAGIAGFDYSNQWGGGLCLYTSPNTSGGGNLTPRMIINNHGDVGINTTNPNEKLDINGGNIRLNSTGTAKIFNHFTGSDYGNLQISSGYQNAAAAPKIDLIGWTGAGTVDGDNLIKFSTNNSVRMFINQSGNVGVGTTAPGSILDVHGASGAAIKKSAPTASTGTYSFILNGPRPGTTGSGATHFINGSTRGEDGGASTYTIRNDSGQLRLGHSSYTTLFQGNHLRMAENDNSYFHFGPNGTWGGELYVGATTDKTSITSASKAQIISTDGNLHLDSGAGKSIYLNHHGGALGAVYRKGPQYWNSRPMVMVGKNNGRVYTGSYVIFDAIGYNDGNMYNSSNGRFTAIWTGYYLFTTTLLGGEQEENANTRWYLNGNNVGWGAAHFNLGNGFNFNYNNARNGLSSQMIYYMNQFDYMQMYIVGGSIYGASYIHTTTTCIYLGGKY